MPSTALVRHFGLEMSQLSFLIDKMCVTKPHAFMFLMMLHAGSAKAARISSDAFSCLTEF
jgi:hypothetical protein